MARIAIGRAGEPSPPDPEGGPVVATGATPDVDVEVAVAAATSLFAPGDSRANAESPGAGTGAVGDMVEVLDVGVETGFVVRVGVGAGVWRGVGLDVAVGVGVGDGQLPMLVGGMGCAWGS
jgi:hypothetical protein